MKTEQELKKVFGHNIFTLRDRRGWTQELLAEKAGVSKNSISDVENGQKFVRADTLVNLALALETDVYELFKTGDILPDKPIDIIEKYGEEVKEALVEIGNAYIKKMKG